VRTGFCYRFKVLAVLQLRESSTLLRRLRTYLSLECNPSQCICCCSTSRNHNCTSYKCSMFRRCTSASALLSQIGSCNRPSTSQSVPRRSNHHADFGPTCGGLCWCCCLKEPSRTGTLELPFELAKKPSVPITCASGWYWYLCWSWLPLLPLLLLHNCATPGGRSCPRNVLRGDSVHSGWAWAEQKTCRKLRVERNAIGLINLPLPYFLAKKLFHVELCTQCCLSTARRTIFGKHVQMGSNHVSGDALEPTNVPRIEGRRMQSAFSLTQSYKNSRSLLKWSDVSKVRNQFRNSGDHSVRVQNVMDMYRTWFWLQNGRYLASYQTFTSVWYIKWTVLSWAFEKASYVQWLY